MSDQPTDDRPASDNVTEQISHLEALAAVIRDHCATVAPERVVAEIYYGGFRPWLHIFFPDAGRGTGVSVRNGRYRAVSGRDLGAVDVPGYAIESLLEEVGSVIDKQA